MKIWLATIVFSVLLLVPILAQDSFAIPVGAGGQYLERGSCDDHTPLPTLTHELGLGPAFPIDERISRSTTTDTSATTSFCTDGGGPMADIIVTITNLGTKHWTDLFYVLDDDRTFGIGNPDGSITSSTSASLAFKIDNVGVNRNLFSESMNADLIFEPGETWRFMIEGPHTRATGFFNPSLIIFSSPAQHGADSTSFNSNASILANEHFPDPCELEPTLPECIEAIGGEIIPIESTSLILAGSQSFSWMIPVVLSVLGIGLFVVSRKSE
jgi:hypothetical protein